MNPVVMSVFYWSASPTPRIIVTCLAAPRPSRSHPSMRGIDECVRIMTPDQPLQCLDWPFAINLRICCVKINLSLNCGGRECYWLFNKEICDVTPNPHPCSIPTAVTLLARHCTCCIDSYNILSYMQCLKLLNNFTVY